MQKIPEHKKTLKVNRVATEVFVWKGNIEKTLRGRDKMVVATK